MHPSMTQRLVSDHIREARQQAAAARQASAARSAVRKASNRVNGHHWTTAASSRR